MQGPLLLILFSRRPRLSNACERHGVHTEQLAEVMRRSSSFFGFLQTRNLEKIYMPRRLRGSVHAESENSEKF